MRKTGIGSVKKIAGKVDGWLSDKEGEFLFNKAKSCTGKGVIVEIGSWKGKSTVWLGLGSKQGKKAKVYAVDPHNAGSDPEVYGKVNTLIEFKKNIKKAKLNGIVIPIVKESMEAVKGWNKPIELLFIDGSHKYEFAKKDFLHWSKYLIDDGIIAFHDSFEWIGTRRVVNELFLNSSNFKDFELIDSITAARKTQSISLNDRIKNNYFKIKKIFRELYYKYNIVKKIIGEKFFSTS